MQQLLVEVNYQDQIYVETQCGELGISLSEFFMKLLNEYREGQAKPAAQTVVKNSESQDIKESVKEDKPKARRGRKPKAEKVISEEEGSDGAES